MQNQSKKVDSYQTIEDTINMSTIGKNQSAIKGNADESICGIAMMFPDANGEWDSMLEDDTKSKVRNSYS